MIEERVFSGCVLSTYKVDGVALAMLTGGLRLQNANEVKQRILDLMGEDVRTLHLYLSQLSELDSAGLGVLVGLHITARKRKIEMSLLSPTAFQMKLFETTRLTSVFTIQTGIEAETLMQRYAIPENRLALAG